MELLLHRDGCQVSGVRIRSGRPLVSRLLVGKPVEEALRLVPLLFSLCGRAQGLAAQAAAATAMGRGMDEESLHQGAKAILREAAGEHLWRLLLDWPAALGLPRRETELAAARRRLATVADDASWRTALDEILAVSLLGQPARRWLDGDLAAWRAKGSPAATLWQAMDGALAGIERVTPSVNENSPLARLQGRLPADMHPVAARFLARLAELALWATGDVPPVRKFIRAQSAAAGQGEALALVARGSLHHRLRIEDGRVAEYAITVPTDWNFAPAGPFAREARGIRGSTAAEIESAARLLALSLDPCVAVKVELLS